MTAPPPLHDLPLAWRGLLTCFLVFLGAGLVFAELNVLGQNQMVDGQPGLSFADLKLKYHGGWVQRTGGQPAPSRMLEMIRGAMRQYVKGDDELRVIDGWLAGGATREAFAAGPPPTPQDALFSCLRCHAAEGGEEIGRKSPFAGDLFSPADYDLVSKFALPGQPGQQRVWRPPSSWQDLTMTAHAHVFSVPTFLLIQAGLFLWAGRPAGASRRAAALRAGLAWAPLGLFMVDMACWWLARIPVVGVAFVAIIGLAGMLFGLTFAVQWWMVIAALWRRPA